MQYACISGCNPNLVFSSSRNLLHPIEEENCHFRLSLTTADNQVRGQALPKAGNNPIVHQMTPSQYGGAQGVDICSLLLFVCSMVSTQYILLVSFRLEQFDTSHVLPISESTQKYIECHLIQVIFYQLISLPLSRQVISWWKLPLWFHSILCKQSGLCNGLLLSIL